MSAALEVYADDVKSSCPGVLSVKVNADPAVCNRFNSLPDVLKVVPVTLASERDAETELINPSTCAFVYPSMVRVITPPLSVIATTFSLPAVVRRRTVVLSRMGVPLPDALVKVACLPASDAVSDDVVV